jgi:hypothetical protein
MQQPHTRRAGQLGPNTSVSHLLWDIREACHLGRNRARSQSQCLLTGPRTLTGLVLNLENHPSNMTPQSSSLTENETQMPD